MAYGQGASDTLPTVATAKLSAATLNEISSRNPKVSVPKYDRSQVTSGIVHIGVGNFHRAHQAAFTDDVLSMPDQLGWGVLGVGMMPFDSKVQEVLKSQDMLYSLWQKGKDSAQLRIIGCHTDMLLAPSDPKAVLAALSATTTKIVTLTVTEKGYFIDLATGHLDLKSPVVSHDMDLLKAGGVQGDTSLKTAAGYLVAACANRMKNGMEGFAILSCDNVQENGCKARTAVLEMAEAVDPVIATWIRANATFPNSMVDRITPATTDEVREQLAAEHQIVDGWPVVCEDFLLWVVEDKFPRGRPTWEKSSSGRCIFVEDVLPYELMKLRLLNSVHQALSYPAALLGHALVHEAMADTRVSKFLQAYMAAAAKTVPPVDGLDKADWITSVLDRFSNPAIRDTIFRLTEDATNRIEVALAPCLFTDACSWNGGTLSTSDIELILLPVACWMRCLLGDEEKVWNCVTNSAVTLPEAAKLNKDERRISVEPLAKKVWNCVKAASNSSESQEAAQAFLTTALGKNAASSKVATSLCALVESLQKNGVEATVDEVTNKKD